MGLNKSENLNILFFTPQMFGAKGDGVTDDTVAFKACFEHTNIFIPAGNYIISDTIDVLSKTEVRGERRDQTYIKFTSDLLFNVQGYASFSDLQIHGHGANGEYATDRTNTAIVFPYKNLRVHNVRFRYMEAAIRSDNALVIYNTFVDCSFLEVAYPFNFPSASVVNTTVISNCEFNNYASAVTVAGHIYAVAFDRCAFEGEKADSYILSANGCVNVSLISCYIENWGQLVPDRCREGNITVSDTWIYKKQVFLAQTNSTNLVVKFVNSTIVNSDSDEESFARLLDGTNTAVNIVDCMTKLGTEEGGLFLIKDVDTAFEFGVATECTVNGGYLTLDTLPLYNGEVE